MTLEELKLSEKETISAAVAGKVLGVDPQLNPRAGASGQRRPRIPGHSPGEKRSNPSPLFHRFRRGQTDRCELIISQKEAKIHVSRVPEFIPKGQKRLPIFRKKRQPSYLDFPQKV